ncbi:TonB-dependent hemoglobin/transferrin/lactoferrin family receptor [Pusillimonas sp. SM2304]|uniref:TonB-dependent hemoglobin/transferrin/lactoferrin family receptor n=1 Tax=Pusillimonas sp. SM2304 TaxID=3073241 RepID=UPI0028753DC4|nr:TonB-dependent hemoglobin/transferrin/lactoferrin family receptor [Pusillimonas sp. SM2304]MDS1140852.1 TonB-dependent hemoglobin/transferrin/lactoferrin family receptor [Pusillimonas sp. SM2304]
MTKLQVWWGGAFLAAAAVQAGAQGSAVAESQPASSGGQAIQTLAPLRIQGQTLASQLPEGATVTTRRQLDERAIESWEDFAKRGEPGVNFSTGSKSVNIRGMDQDRVVTRVDGIRIPWMNDGARDEKGGLDTINFNTLSSIDLVRAAGAPQSGSLVGYLNLRTLAPDDLLGLGQDFGALVRSGYDSADDSWGLDAALAGRLGDSGTRWLVQAGQRKGHEMDNQGRVGGYGPLRDKPNPETYTQRNVMLKLQHDFNAEHRVTASGELFKRTGTVDSLHAQGTLTFALGGNYTDKESSRKRAVLGYEFRSIEEKAAVSRGDVKLYWQRGYQAGSQHAIRLPDPRGEVMFGPFPVGQVYGYGYPYGPYGRSNSIQKTGRGLLTEWQGYLMSGGLQHHWAVGGEWYGNRLEQRSTGYDNCPDFLLPNPPLGPRSCDLLHTNQSDIPQADGDQWSLWAQNEMSWAEGKYALTPALRFDAYRFSPEAGGAYDANPNARVTALSSTSGQRLSPSLLAAYRPREDLSFYAKYGYGYKAPSATQLYTNYGAPGTYLRVGNPNLKAEVSRGWELGMDAGTADLGGRLSVFDNRYRDFIEEEVPLNPDSPEWNPAWAGVYPMGVTGFANRSRVRIYGAELSGHWNINSNWYTWGSLAWSRGKDQDTDRYLNSVAPLKAILALGYRSEQWGAEAITTLAKRRSHVEYPEATADVSTPDFQAPGYGLLDLTAWWKPQAVKGVRLQAGIYNAFDKKYWNALNVPRPGRDPHPIDYYTEPGRSFRVSLTYQY